MLVVECDQSHVLRGRTSGGAGGYGQRGVSCGPSARAGLRGGGAGCAGDAGEGCDKGDRLGEVEAIGSSVVKWEAVLYIQL